MLLTKLGGIILK